MVFPMSSSNTLETRSGLRGIIARSATDTARHDLQLERVVERVRLPFRERHRSSFQPGTTGVIMSDVNAAASRSQATS
jgi:hypothetical protein